MDHLFNVYRPIPLALERGEGVMVYDNQGNAYLDFLSGVAVTALGHAHPEITKTIQEQAARILHCSNVYHIPNQEALAKVLCDRSGLDRAFFCNSGAEAVETTIKLARRHGHARGFSVPKIIVFEHSFHGRTMATITASGSKKAQENFEPLLEGFIRVPYNDMEAIRKLNDKEIAAILVEPVQGESGIRIPNPDFLNQLRDLCTQNDWMFIVDEVQTGMGRTGVLFAYQDNKIVPDVISLAKGLGNGIPIGACLASERFAQLFTPGSHGSTFGGNPLSTAVALTTIKVIEQENLCENAKIQGERLLKGLKDNLSHHKNVKEIRGKGLMIGIEVDTPCRDMMVLGAENGIIFTVSNENVVRLLPPLILNQAHVDDGIQRITKTIHDFFNQKS